MKEYTYICNVQYKHDEYVFTEYCRLYPYTSFYPSEFLQIFSYSNFGVAAR